MNALFRLGAVGLWALLVMDVANAQQLVPVGNCFVLSWYN